MSFSHHRRHSMDPVDPTAMPSCSHWPIPQRLFGAHNGWITLPCWKCVLSQPGTCADSETVKNPQSLSLHWVTQRAEAAPRKYPLGGTKQRRLVSQRHRVHTAVSRPAGSSVTGSAVSCWLAPAHRPGWSWKVSCYISLGFPTVTVSPHCQESYFFPRVWPSVTDPTQLLLGPGYLVSRVSSQSRKGSSERAW